MSAPVRSILMCSLLLTTTALGGCFRYENDPGEGGVTIGEARELDEIAAELDARPQAPGASLDNASDDNDMTGAVTQTPQAPQETPVPANPAAIKDGQQGSENAAPSAQESDKQAATAKQPKKTLEAQAKKADAPAQKSAPKSAISKAAEPASSTSKAEAAPTVPSNTETPAKQGSR